MINFSITPGPTASAGTCDEATSWCAKACYAKRHNYAYQNVKDSLAWRTEQTFSDTFVEEMTAAIKRTKQSVVRIHVAGDFYSVEYIQKWVAIAKVCPDVKFFAFTRAWKNEEKQLALEELRALPNVQVFASVDQTTGEIPPETWRTAYVLPTKTGTRVDGYADRVENAKPAIHCPEQTGQKENCLACGYCFRGKRGDVLFQYH